MSEVKKYQISVKGEALITRYGAKSRMATILNGMGCSQLESNFAESELREYLAFLENQNEGLYKHVSELISTIEKLIEAGSVLIETFQNYPDFEEYPEVGKWDILVDEWQERE